MAKPQTKFTLDDDERTYLRWLAKTLYLMDWSNENEVAKTLVRQAIYDMRRKHAADEPSVEDMRRILGPGDD